MNIHKFFPSYNTCENRGHSFSYDLKSINDPTKITVCERCGKTMSVKEANEYENDYIDKMFEDL